MFFVAEYVSEIPSNVGYYILVGLVLLFYVTFLLLLVYYALGCTFLDFIKFLRRPVPYEIQEDTDSRVNSHAGSNGNSPTDLVSSASEEATN